MATAIYTEVPEHWTADAIHLYIWTFGNDHAHGLSGIYACQKAVIIAETRLKAKRLEAAKAIIGDKVRWYPDGWLWVVARAKHAVAGNTEKYLTGLLSRIETVPREIQEDFWKRYRITTIDGKQTLEVIPSQSHPNPIDRLSLESESESESESNPNQSTPLSPQRGPESSLEDVASELMNAWNQMAESLKLPKVRDFIENKSRMRTLAARLKSDFWRGKWKLALSKIADYPFLCGEDTTFKANIDWFLTGKAVPKVIEGGFPKRPAAQQAGVDFEENFFIKAEREKRLRDRGELPPLKEVPL